MSRGQITTNGVSALQHQSETEPAAEFSNEAPSISQSTSAVKPLLNSETSNGAEAVNRMSGNSPGAFRTQSQTGSNKRPESSRQSISSNARNIQAPTEIRKSGQTINSFASENNSLVRDSEKKDRTSSVGKLNEDTDANKEDSVNLRKSYEKPGSDSIKSGSSQASYLIQKDLEVKPLFFDVLGEIPSITQISLYISDGEETAEILQQSEKNKGKDERKGVNPYTSEAEPPPVMQQQTSTLEEHHSVSGEPQHPLAETQSEEEQEYHEEEQESEDEDLLLPPDIEDEIQVETLDDTGLDLWYTLEPQKTVRMMEAVDLDLIERMENERKNKEAILKFLEGLIAQIVEKCEYVDPNALLRSNLNKIKLVTELDSKLRELEIEQKARLFLNRKAVEYFRRKKIFRSITEDNADTISQAIEKYKEAITALDQLLGREEETQNCINFRIAELEGEVFDVEELAETSIQQFEELVKKTLWRDTFDKLPVVVDSLLKKIAIKREEVSKTRLVLIRRQHTFAKLLEKSSKLENIGGGLQLKDYEHLQTDTLAISKKIEERSTELNKLRSRYNADLHIMAHVKEKQQMLRSTIAIEEVALRGLTDEKQTCRERLYELKINRNQMRREIRDLSFQGGLIDKPALMLDYDETVARLETLRIRAEQNKQELDYIEKRIEAIEKVCKSHEDFERKHRI